MAIRHANNCSNCENLVENSFCSKHKVMVSARYTCDQFNMKVEFKNERNCTNCAKHDTSSCAHPQKAAPGMLCASWAPQAIS
ncbi:hypothetical protein [Psychroflexus aestuariivivens]|uniref:hypothetical protein n=1 Tax=Psychroflexus aestuariivivens TaxID=1795040 RepID=UPI000FD86608|nr:hypothetical protein [Psychroflexus aestuariivivens]